MATFYLPSVDASGNTTSITLCYETGNWYLCLIRFGNQDLMVKWPWLWRSVKVETGDCECWHERRKVSWASEMCRTSRLLSSKVQDTMMSSMKCQKIKAIDDKFAYKVHPIHFHDSKNCQALQFQIVWLYVVEIYFTCMSLFGLLCNILDCDTVNYAWLCLIVHFPLWDSGSLAPCILSLATKWMWVVSIGLQPFYPWDKSSWSGLDVVLQNKSMISKGSKPKFSCSPARKLVTIMAELR